jgi:hypothetical protein
LLVDATHKRWIWITALLAVLSLGLYGWLDWRTPGELTGGSSVGLWYGIVGTLLMLYAGLLAGHRKVPRWGWLGPRKAWLRGHIWLGLLSVVLILCHSGFSWGGPLELALWIVFALTILTGIYGLLLQQVLPRMITTRVPCEAPYEQIPHICEVMRRKADGLLSAMWKADAQAPQASMMLSQLGIGAKLQLQEFYDGQVRAFLTEEYEPSSPLANPLQADAAFSRLRALPGLADVAEQINELQALCDERRLLAEQERLYHWLHAWLLAHIPLSVALLVLAVAHVVMALYY